MANAKLFVQSANKYLDGWDRLIYVLDANQDELDKMDKEQFGNTVFHPAIDLFDDDFNEFAFYFQEDNLKEFVTIKSIKKSLIDYDLIIIAECEIVLLKKVAFFDDLFNTENTIIKVSHSNYSNNLPSESFDTSGDLRKNPCIYAISNGVETNNFINWCEKKIAYLCSNSISSIDDYEHTLNKADEKSNFIRNWLEYANYFMMLSITQPVIYTMLPTTNKFSYDMSDLYFIIMDSNIKQGSLSVDSNQKALILQYQNDIQEFNRKNNIENIYKFDFFNDGTKIHKLLRVYYFKNFRLRDNCKNNPFANRNRFTDDTIVTGDEKNVPINAMAASIWSFRGDLQQCFPNYKTKDRAGFVNWYITNVESEYNVSNVYAAAISENYNDYNNYNYNYCNPVNKYTNVDRAKRKILKTFGYIKPKEAIVKKPLRINELDNNYPRGINLSGFIRGDFGLGEATRILARTFEAGKIPFCIINYQPNTSHNFTNKEYEEKITNIFTYNTNIMLINQDGTQDFFESISNEATDKRYNIGVWYWELPEFPEKWIKYFDYFDEIWTASTFTVESFKKVTQKPVYCLPCCVTVEFDKGLDRKHFNLPENNFLFLMMYDYRSVSARKNPMAVVNAFLKSFESNTNANLLIKMNKPSHWDIEDELLILIKSHKNIIIIDETMSRIEVNSLINCCDAFVSLHRSEGFGLGPAEAMYLGKPAILTNWSGNTEYMTKDNCCPVDCEIIEIEKTYGPYEKGFHWAEPDVDQASEYMKRLVEDKEYYKSVATKGEKYIKGNFSPEAISNIAKKRLDELGLL